MCSSNAPPSTEVAISLMDPNCSPPPNNSQTTPIDQCPSYPIRCSKNQFSSMNYKSTQMESMRVYLVYDAKECCPAFLPSYLRREILPVLRLPTTDTQVVLHLSSSKDPYHFYLYGNQPENRTCYTMVQSNGETRWVTREICLKGICERLARQDIEYLVYCSECDTDLCNREDLYRIVPNIVEVPINAVCLGRGTNVALLLITCVVGILLGVLPLN
ncbi:hypothetical protein M8J77_004242 [Diaphorina citri]|nr:hypothetical protein M8J77_004242 [Diaphorina citri]